MNLINSFGFRFALLTLALLTLGVNVVMISAKHSQEVPTSLPNTSLPNTTVRNGRPKPIPIPPDGSAVTPNTNGSVPGNPEQTMDYMKRLYQDLQTFAKRHNGAFPAEGALISAMARNPQQYGYAGAMEAARSGQNSDMQYSDRAYGQPQPETYYPYVIKDVRPDGNRVGGAKNTGTRDVLAYTDMYFHQNLRTYPNGKSTRSPVGFYLVLWDDGEVQKVAYQKVRFVTPPTARKGNIVEVMVFPGQAGAPPQGTMSRAEYEKWVNDHF